MQDLKSIRDLWKKFRFILTPTHKRWGIVIMFMTLIGALFETLGISIILPLVQVMISPADLWKNDYIQKIASFLNISGDTQLILLIGTFVILIYIFKNIYLCFLSYVRVKYACKVQRELSVEMMRSYMNRNYSYFLKADTGKLLRGMTVCIQNTFNALLQILRIFAELLTAGCICIFIMATDISMAAGVIFLAAFCLILVIYGFRNWMKRAGERGYKYAAIINKLIIQAFEGIKEILVMNRREYFTGSYEEKYVKQQSAAIGQTIASESPVYIIEGVCVAGLMIMVCMKGIEAQNTSILVPQLASFAVAAFRILPSLGRISSYFNQFIYCIPSINDTYVNFSEVRASEEIRKRKDLEQDVHFRDKITLKDVTWNYEDNEKTVLDRLNLTIKKGKSVAFIGQSGAGKTTLADIILGLLIPADGCVKVDDTDIRNIPVQWSRLVGYVPQTVYLTDDTIRNNIAFGIQEDEIKDELVWKALEQAQMKEYVKGLSERLDTMVGERGIRFSGGQRQRLAIARALYCEPEILVLDEATSALDTNTENAVMESMDALQGKKTLIIIAHRLSTVRNCDEIYEIGGGKATLKRKADLFA